MLPHHVITSFQDLKITSSKMLPWNSDFKLMQTEANGPEGSENR